MSVPRAKSATASMNIYVNVYASTIDSSTQAKPDQMTVESFGWR